MSNSKQFARVAAAAVGLLLAAGAALAAPPAPAPASGAVPVPKIIVINRSDIMTRAKVSQDIDRQGQAFMLQAQKDLKAEGDGLRRDQQALQQQITILAPDVKKKKIADFQARAMAFQQKVAARRATITYSVLKAREQVSQALQPILSGIMAERGANMLVDRQIVLMSNVDVDVTQKVIDRLDQKLPSVKVQLVNPPPDILRQIEMQQAQGQ